MGLFEHPEFDNHENVAFYHDPLSGLQAIIAVHNTNLGSALGGCRMWPYADSAEALTDVLRLSKGMTLKAAMADLPQGGGKAVIIGDPRRDKSPQMMRAMGQFVDSFSGRYYIAEDSGISVQDMHYMAEESPYVSGNQAKYHFRGEKADGNPAPSTAYGVFIGLKAAVEWQLKTDLRDVRVAVQGMGHVGYRLTEHLCDAGASVIATDIFKENLKVAEDRFGIQTVAPDEILTVDADVLAPCAMGAVLNEQSIPTLKAKVVAGAANNQLSTDAMGELCRQGGILYAPDYVVNAGGIIDIYHQTQESSDNALRVHIEKIGATLRGIFDRAQSESLATNHVADKIAKEVVFLPS